MTEPDPRSPVQVEQQLTTQITTISDAQVRLLVTAWVTAFSEVSADLQDTLTSILTAGTRLPASVLRRSRRLAIALDGIGQRLDDLTSQAGIIVTSDIAGVVRRGVDAQATLIRSQLEPGQVLPGFDPLAVPDTRQLEAIVHRSTQQVTSLLKPVAPDTEDLIKRELIRGVAVGSNPKVTARRMVDRVNDHANFGLTRATTIARTETLDAYRGGAQAGERKHTRVLAGWVWLAHLGPRTCPSCLAKHGSLHDLDEPGPQDHPQGRCARMPVVRRADGSVNLSFVPDARKFFDGLPHEDQVAIMGRRRLELLHSGAVDLAEMTTRRESSSWRPSWQVTPIRDLVKVPSAA